MAQGGDAPQVADVGQAAGQDAGAEWRALAAKASGDAVLTSRSADGMTIEPLYSRAASSSPRPWRKPGSWAVSQKVDHPDVTVANASALLDLEGGADALTLVYAGSPYARGFGLPDDADIGVLLDAVEIDFIGLRLDAGFAAPAAARALAHLVKARVLTSADLTIDVGHDPIGLLARTGKEPPAEDLERVLDCVEAAGLAGRALMVDGRAYHEAGAGEAQELAAVLATGVAYLRRLELLGLTPDAGRETLAFLLAFDADVVLGLAKARAMRRLWARIEVASGLEPRPVRLHAETSWRMMTRREPWTNVMRTTAATFAAGIGGSDAVTVLPFTLAIGLPDDAARRLARNVQRVAIDEANLAMVEDPAAGAGGFEALTTDLCEKAWTLFQAIEAEGGIEASLRSGGLPARTAETARERSSDIAAFRRGIVGINRFPSLDVPTVAVLDTAPRAKQAEGEGALPSRRDAEPFEALRDRADARETRPRLYLAAIGAPAAFGASATYAVNFFAAAGIAAEAPAAQRDVETVVRDFEASGAAAACLCGSKEAYGEHAVALAAALRSAGAKRILMAGRAGSAWHDADVDAFIHDGCAALAILGEVLDIALASS